MKQWMKGILSRQCSLAPVRYCWNQCLTNPRTFEVSRSQKARWSFAGADCRTRCQSRPHTACASAGTTRYVPGLLPLFALQTHCHHSPSQILHALLIWQLRLRLAVELPYLRRQRVLLLHLFGRFEVSTGSVVPPIREERLTKEFLAWVMVS